MVNWTEDFFGEFGKTGVCWECFCCPWRDLWRFTFSGEVDFESGGLKDFVKSDMERGGNFGFIDVESIESIGEDVAVGRVIWSG